MYKTSFADKSELDDILCFFESRGWVENVWLASEVVEAFGPEDGFYKVLVCRTPKKLDTPPVRPECAPDEVISSVSTYAARVSKGENYTHCSSIRPPFVPLQEHAVIGLLRANGVFLPEATPSAASSARNDIAGVAVLRLKKRNAFTEGYRVHIEAVDEDALQTLLNALPEGESKTFFIYSRQIQNYMEALSNLSGSYCDLYYTVDSHLFRPVEDGDIVELTSENASLLQGLEDEPDWENIGDRKIYAVVRDNRAVSRVCIAPLEPAMRSGKQAISISDLFTEDQYRRQGLGKRLVSYVTGLILKDNNVPVYWTDPDNIASQKLVLGLGYRQYAQLAVYR